MRAQLKSLLKPEVLNTVSGLELVARIIVEGFMSGSNQSQTIGVGQEFSQYRSYEPGDDLRLLDWKMYGRSERYYIKLADIETNITVKFVLDTSRSMSYAENGISKLQTANVLIAALAYLARKQSDTLGLYCINDQTIDVVQPRFEQQQFMRILNALVHAKSDGRWNKSKKLDSLLQHQGKEMILFFTDLYDEENDLLHFIKRLKNKRNEVIVFHILGDQEATLNYEGVFTFEDLENGNRVKVDAKQQAATYQQNLSKWIERVRHTLLEKQISYENITMATPPEMALRTFLTSRKKLVR